METKTKACGPIPGDSILTHTHAYAYPYKHRFGIGIRQFPPLSKAQLRADFNQEEHVRARGPRKMPDPEAPCFMECPPLPLASLEGFPASGLPSKAKGPQTAPLKGQGWGTGVLPGSSHLDLGPNKKAQTLRIGLRNNSSALPFSCQRAAP